MPTTYSVFYYAFKSFRVECDIKTAFCKSLKNNLPRNLDVLRLNRKMNSLSADIIKNLPTEVHEAVEMGIVKFAIPCPAGLRRAVEEGMYSH